MEPDPVKPKRIPFSTPAITKLLFEFFPKDKAQRDKAFDDCRRFVGRDTDVNVKFFDKQKYARVYYTSHALDPIVERFRSGQLVALHQVLMTGLILFKPSSDEENGETFVVMGIKGGQCYLFPHVSNALDDSAFRLMFRHMEATDDAIAESLGGYGVMVCQLEELRAFKLHPKGNPRIYIGDRPPPAEMSRREQRKKSTVKDKDYEYLDTDEEEEEAEERKPKRPSAKAGRAQDRTQDRDGTAIGKGRESHPHEELDHQLSLYGKCPRRMFDWFRAHVPFEEVEAAFKSYKASQPQAAKAAAVFGARAFDVGDLVNPCAPRPSRSSNFKVDAKIFARTGVVEEKGSHRRFLHLGSFIEAYLDRQVDAERERESRRRDEEERNLGLNVDGDAHRRKRLTGPAPVDVGQLAAEARGEGRNAPMMRLDDLVVDPKGIYVCVGFRPCVMGGMRTLLGVGEEVVFFLLLPLAYLPTMSAYFECAGLSLANTLYELHGADEGQTFFVFPSVLEAQPDEGELRKLLSGSLAETAQRWDTLARQSLRVRPDVVQDGVKVTVGERSLHAHMEECVTQKQRDEVASENRSRRLAVMSIRRDGRKRIPHKYRDKMAECDTQVRDELVAFFERSFPPIPIPPPASVFLLPLGIIPVCSGPSDVSWGHSHSCRLARSVNPIVDPIGLNAMMEGSTKWKNFVLELSLLALARVTPPCCRMIGQERGVF